MDGACQWSETASLNQTHQDHHDGGKCSKHGSRLFFDFMPNHTPYSGTPQRSRRAATRQDGTTDRPNTRSNGGVLLLLGHACAGRQGYAGQGQHGRVGDSDQWVNCFHGWLLRSVDESLLKLCVNGNASLLRGIKIKDMSTEVCGSGHTSGRVALRLVPCLCRAVACFLFEPIKPFL